MIVAERDGGIAAETLDDPRQLVATAALVVEEAAGIASGITELRDVLRSEEVVVHPCRPDGIAETLDERIARIRAIHGQHHLRELAHREPVIRGVPAVVEDGAGGSQPALAEGRCLDESDRVGHCRSIEALLIRATIVGMAGIDSLVDELERSYIDLQARLSDPAVYNDHREAADVGRRLKELETPYKLAVAWRGAQADLADVRSDPELSSMAAELESDVERLEEELKLALVERDPADSKDVIVEIRQGVGGDEAALWAGDVYRMLSRYAERRGFKTEILSANESESGGFKEIVFAVKGDGAFSVYKYEGGTHRVQRVPETESQGRIHTSTATVAVMPEAEEVEIEIAEADLKIDVYRSTGPGGQSVNTTDSAVRITHLPTGVVVAMQDEKSQLQNRQKAMRVLRARLYELEREKEQARLSAARKSQIGGGERAEKIRTYNFAENRLTDHRIKLTVHRLDQILDGDLEEFTDAIQAEDRRLSLEAV